MLRQNTKFCFFKVSDQHRKNMLNSQSNHQRGRLFVTFKQPRLQALTPSFHFNIGLFAFLCYRRHQAKSFGFRSELPGDPLDHILFGLALWRDGMNDSCAVRLSSCPVVQCPTSKCPVPVSGSQLNAVTRSMSTSTRSGSTQKVLVH